MSFNPNIPRPTDLLSNSQGDLLANNIALNTTFSRNHIALNTATDNGKHKFVELPVQTGIPTPVPGLTGTSGTVYTRTTGGESQLYYTPGSSGNQYQLTRTISASFARFATNTAYVSVPPNGNTVSGGWTFLPGGMLLQYGVVNFANSVTSVTYPIAFTGPAFMIQATAVTSSSGGDQTAAIRIGQGTATGFQINSTSTSTVTGFNWMAVGI